MLSMSKINNEVYVANTSCPSIGYKEINFLQNELPNSQKGRVRLCVHRSNSERMHEMFIAFAGGNYVRPSKHFSKDESLHVLNGVAEYVFFDSVGNVTDVVPLGVYESERQVYCRIPAETEHALVIRSDDVFAHEITLGPFNRSDTVFSPWAPEDTNAQAINRFLFDMQCLKLPKRAALAMAYVSENVFVATEKIVSVGRNDLDVLKKTIGGAARNRISLHLHKRDDELLHEVLAIYQGVPYVKPSKHISQEKSFHVVVGQADCILFDEAGNVTSVVPLGDKHSGKQLYIRVPASVYHTVVMRSESLVIHEAYLRDSVICAPWAADESDLPAVDLFMNRLYAATANVDQN